MARFDVYSHPDATLRRTTPYLLDIQNSHIRGIATRIVIPLRAAAVFDGPRIRDLHPTFTIAGREVVADTAALAAFPAADLKVPVATLKSESSDVVGALDTLFGSY